MASDVSDKLTKYTTLLTGLILVALPFHALFTTWAGSNFSHIDIWRIWKELLIFAMMPIVFWLGLRTPTIKNWIQDSLLARLLLVYLLLHLVLGFWALQIGNVNLEALAYGLLSNLRFFGFFAICLTLATRSRWLHQKWWRLLLLPALAVVSFGLLQLVLPLDFLTHFGYGPETIPAYQTIDQKVEYQRIQSTLRGANPLGAYLLAVIVGLVAYKRKKMWQKYCFLAASLLALFFTYSRSAWIGMAVALMCLIVLFQPTIRRYKKQIALAACAAVLVAGLGLVFFRDNDYLENTLFHTNEQSVSSESSNESRSQALKQGAEDIVSQPLGQGPGTAGPASTRNDHPARIAENYYLQIGQEVGLLGLGLFVAINVVVARGLWTLRADKRAQALFVSLIGLSVVNLVSHAWADDTLGLLWWGLAGVVYSGVILNEKRKHNGTKKIPTKA